MEKAFVQKTFGERSYVENEFGEKAFTERTYEVIRFVRHQNRCHPAMDCVPGQLLIYRVQQYPEMEKKEALEWARKLAEQLEMYHHCKNGQPYRYLNPYSVLVTRDGDVALLDLEAQSNEFVLRNMQKRAMRNHFVRPIVHIKESERQFLDLYGYGKTVQFILANVKIRPALTRGEERRLARVIEKCTCENPKKQFVELEQIKKELPVAREEDLGVWKKRIAYVVVPVVSLAVSVSLGVRLKNAGDDYQSVVGQLKLQAGENEKLRESNERLLAENQNLLEQNQVFQTENKAVQEENQKLREESQKLREEARSLQEADQGLEEGGAEEPQDPQEDGAEEPRGLQEDGADEPQGLQGDGAEEPQG